MPITDVINSLLQNKLFLQYLSGVGADVGAGGTGIQAMNQVTQQNISAQNMASLFGKMLSGQVPKDASLVMKEDGMQIKLPSNLYTGSSQEVGDTLMAGGTNPPGGIADTQRNSMLKQLLNPSSSQPGISASDLAGLSTTDVTNAFKGALSVEELKQKKVTDVVDMISKLAQAYRALQPERLNMDYPIKVPGIAPVTADNPHGLGTVSTGDWASLPAEQKQYASYLNIAQAEGNTNVLSFEDFINKFEQTDREKFLRAAMGDEALMAAAKDLARSGALRLSIGEKVETEVRKKEALSERSGKFYFDNPDWVDDVAKHLSEPEVSTKINISDNPAQTRAEERVRYIESKIRTGGDILDVRYDKDNPKIMVWTIKWKDGSTGVKRYAIWD